MALARAARALRRGAADAGPTQSPFDRATLRRRRASRRHALVRHGVRRGGAAHRVLPVTRDVDRGAPGAGPRGRRGRAVRPRSGGDPPRPEAVEHPRDARRHREAARLRDRQAPREPRRTDRPDADRPASTDPGLRGARTDPRRSRGDPHRRLRPGSDPLRAADRTAAVRRVESHAGRGGCDRHGAGARAPLGRGAAGAGCDGSPSAGGPAPRSVAPLGREDLLVGPRRAVPDRDAPGSAAALPDGGGADPRPRSLPRGRAAAGPSRHGGLPAGQVRPAQPCGRRRGGARAGDGGRAGGVLHRPPGSCAQRRRGRSGAHRADPAFHAAPLRGGRRGGRAGRRSARRHAGRTRRAGGSEPLRRARRAGGVPRNARGDLPEAGTTRAGGRAAPIGPGPASHPARPRRSRRGGKHGGAGPPALRPGAVRGRRAAGPRGPRGLPAGPSGRSPRRRRGHGRAGARARGEGVLRRGDPGARRGGPAPGTARRDDARDGVPHCTSCPARTSTRGTGRSRSR